MTTKEKVIREAYKKACKELDKIKAKIERDTLKENAVIRAEYEPKLRILKGSKYIALKAEMDIKLEKLDAIFNAQCKNLRKDLYKCWEIEDEINDLLLLIRDFEMHNS